jgi:hypothetical protein
MGADFLEDATLKFTNVRLSDGCVTKLGRFFGRR